ARRGALRRVQPGAHGLVRHAARRRSRRACRPVRGRRPGRPAGAGDLARLRLHRDHRGLPRPPASHGRADRRPGHGAVLPRRRERADHGRPAPGGDRRVPGHAVVLPARLRRARALPHSLRRGARAASPRGARGGAGDVSVDGGVLMLITVIGAATPLLLAALGELVVEKSGVLNLGIEGMMLAGAVTAFATAILTGSSSLGIVTGALAGAALALIFAVLTMSLLANQVATGLALTIFGIGLSALIGAGFVGTPAERLPRLAIPGVSDLPVLGPLLFRHDFLVYLSIAMTGAVAWFLLRTRAGMILRAVGESHEAAHAIGYPVIRIRYLAILFGGIMSGLGGAYLSLSYTPMWVEEMTAGRGWIALALVVFAAWRPWRLLLGAYLFGGVTILQLYAQGSALFHVPAQLLSMLPYLATIAVLTFFSAGPWKGRLNAPACLGRPFHPTL